MATYVVERDTYAGWSSTGQYFAYFGLAAGTVGLTGWAAMHGYLPGLRPADAGDQLLIAAMAWVGCGLFAVMAVGVLGSLLLSNKSRGTVTIDDVGVMRKIGERARILRWEEIEGSVAMGYGGVTLIPLKGTQRIEIPRFLDDYRGCIAKIKARGIGSLPSSRFKSSLLKRKCGWRENLRIYGCIYAFSLAYDARASHAARVGSLGVWIGLVCWMMMGDTELEDHGWVRWIGGAGLIAMLAWLVRRMMHTW